MTDTITVRLTEDGPARIRGNGRTWERGESRDVPPEKAEALTSTHDYFEVVDGPEPEAEVEAESGPDEDASGGTITTDDIMPDESDDGEFDVDEWLEQDFDDRADAVRAGEVDDHLEEIADHETSDTVLDAVGERRAELEG